MYTVMRTLFCLLLGGVALVWLVAVLVGFGVLLAAGGPTLALTPAQLWLGHGFLLYVATPGLILFGVVTMLVPRHVLPGDPEATGRHTGLVFVGIGVVALAVGCWLIV